MPKATKTTKTEAAADIDLKMYEGRVTVAILGATPLIYNAMSAKVRQGLLLPRKKTKAEQAQTLKHDPPQEFRSSVYRAKDGPTLLSFPAVAFKRALASAALDTGSAKRTQIDRLCWALGEHVPVYGVPQLRMDVVRSADINKTPDIRTRACLPEWACTLTLAYVSPALTEKTIIDLLASAGMIRGIGDFRQEKGAGNYGQFRIVGIDDPDYLRVVSEGGRAAQQAALDEPVAYDPESEELLLWWHEEAARRGRTPTTNSQEALQ